MSALARLSRPAVAPAAAAALPRELAEEVPIALCYNGASYAVMMATPHDLADLAAGFTLTERLTDDPGALGDPEIARHAGGIELRLWLPAADEARLAARRRFMAGPVGCGLCGVESLAQALPPVPRVAAPAQGVDAREAASAVAALRDHQPLHDRTRAVHAAGLWRPGHGLVAVREDVGRHNAADKLVGALVRSRLPRDGVLVLTSRISVELVQKAAAAGFGAIAAVSAPTTLAVRTAAAAGLTLYARAGAACPEVHAP